MATINGVTIGGKPVYEAASGSHTNIFETHTGASRYGKGRFLMVRSDYDAVISGLTSDNQTVPLVMSSGPDPSSQNKLTLKVIISGQQAASTSAGSSRSMDIVEVVVFDQRCMNTLPVTKAYNVQQQGFPVDGSGNPIFYPSTLNSGSAFTWEQAVDDAEIIGGTIPSPPSWNPRNLIWKGVPKNRCVDDVCARLFLIAGYNGGDPQNDVIIYTPGQNAGTNTKLMGSASKALIGGNQAERNENRLPNTYRVSFQSVGPDAAVDPYVTGVTSGLYTVDKTTGLGFSSPNRIQPLHVGEYLAIFSGGTTPINSSELGTVATDIASRAKAAVNVTFGEYEYAGIWPFVLDGNIRGIQWISDRHGARTRIRLNNDADWTPLGEHLRLIEQTGNQLVEGMGSTSVGMGTGGTRFIATMLNENAVFVRISPATGPNTNTDVSLANNTGWYFGTNSIVGWNGTDADEPQSTVAYNRTGAGQPMMDCVAINYAEIFTDTIPVDLNKYTMADPTANAIMDESGDVVFDENGASIYDEGEGSTHNYQCVNAGAVTPIWQIGMLTGQSVTVNGKSYPIVAFWDSTPFTTAWIVGSVTSLNVQVQAGSGTLTVAFTNPLEAPYSSPLIPDVNGIYNGGLASAQFLTISYGLGNFPSAYTAEVPPACPIFKGAAGQGGVGTGEYWISLDNGNNFAGDIGLFFPIIVVSNNPLIPTNVSYDGGVTWVTQPNTPIA